LHEAFAFGIQRTGGFIQQQDRCILEYRPGDSDTLALPARQAQPAFPEECVETAG